MTWSSSLAAAGVAPPPTFCAGSAGISAPSLVVNTNVAARRTVFSIFYRSTEFRAHQFNTVA
jgi:hypothetical protein